MRGFAEHDKHCRELRWQRGEESGDTDESNVLLGVSTTTPGSSEAKETDTAEVKCQSGTGIRACIDEGVGRWAGRTETSTRMLETINKGIQQSVAYQWSHRHPKRAGLCVDQAGGSGGSRRQYYTTYVYGGTDGQC